MCEFSPGDELNDETIKELYRVLKPMARNWVNGANLPVWKGQEKEVAEDIMQGAIMKFFEDFCKKRECGIRISSPRALGIKIALRHFIDQTRREWRLVRFPADETTSGGQFLIDPSQEVEDKIYEEWVLATTAKVISAFSTKLRAAILADLANRSLFDEQPGTLQRALMAFGIRLQDYQCAPAPIGTPEYRRQSTLRSMAYKRLSQKDIG